MSKYLYILRHAQADMGFNQKDADRPLTAHGYEQAKNITAHLKNIDMALCSSAVRTRETLETAIAHGETPNKIKFTHDLYNASADIILQEIRDVYAQNLLIVAHNPGVHLVAHELTKSDNSPLHDKLSMSYPPCNLTILECDIEDWSTIGKNSNQLLDFITL